LDLPWVKAGEITFDYWAASQALAWVYSSWKGGMITNLTNQRSNYETLRKVTLDNSVSPALVLILYPWALSLIWIKKTLIGDCQIR
jgi:hypothetical protein